MASTYAGVDAPATAGTQEDRRRFVMLLVLLWIGVQATFALAWDIQWHAAIGRDRFWTPPHTALYTAVAMGGLANLYMVLSTTWRYRQGCPGVDDTTTTRIFGVFHAPIGYVAAGFGMLVLMLAAPLDDYWHRLYGIDVTIWAPFHVMGLLGGELGRAGLVYAAFAEANRQAPNATRLDRYRLIGLASLALLLSSMLIVALPSTYETVFAWIYDRPLALYPVILGFIAPAFLVAAATTFPIAWGATLLAGAFTAWRSLIVVMVPLAIQWQMITEGYSLRPDAPSVVVPTMPWPVMLLVSAVAVDLLARVARRRGWSPGQWGPWAGSLVAFMATWLDLPWAWYAVETHIGGPVGLLLMALPLVVGLGALGGAVGIRVGDALRAAER